MRIFNRILGSTRRKLLALGLVLGIAAIPVAAIALAEWGPTRPTFDWNDPAHYPRSVVFNSFTNNPTVGDERTFYDGYEYGSTNIQNTLTVQDNERVVLRVYFHNNAASNANQIAHNTRVKMVLPSAAATDQTSVAYISADNATPQYVWDSVHLQGNQPFTLQYEPGSAKLWNYVFRGQPLSDSIVTDSGAPVGYNAIDGNVPGCSEFSGWVTVVVQVHMQKPQAQFACTGLDVAKIDNNRFDFTAHGSATNATIQSYGFTAVNGSGTVVDTNTVTTSATSAVYHFNQSTPDTYTVSAVVNTDKGSTGQTSLCTKQVTVATPPVVSSAVTSLPNTGAGSTIALFSGVSLLAGIGHYMWNARRARL